MLIGFEKMKIVDRATGKEVMRYKKGLFRVKEDDMNWIIIYDDEMNIIDCYNRQLFKATYDGSW